MSDQDVESRREREAAEWRLTNLTKLIAAASVLFVLIVVLLKLWSYDWEVKCLFVECRKLIK